MSEPFAAIPISWGAKPCPYHTFLIWIACSMSGVDGYNGLKAGEIRFSRRDVEIATGHPTSTVVSNISKAIRHGMLTPRGQHGRKRGEGQIYACGEELLKTRNLYSVPRMFQETTKTQQSKPMETNELGHQMFQGCSKDVPRADRLIDRPRKTKKNTVPPTPKQGEKMEEILEWNDMDYSDVFWQVLKPFPPDKKPYPKTIAKCFMSAVREGGDPNEMLRAATDLLTKRGPQYMPNAATWMKEEGWLSYANR